MSTKRVQIEVTSQQLDRLRKEVFADMELSGEQRRKAAKRVLLLPQNGNPVDIYFDGKFVGAI